MKFDKCYYCDIIPTVTSCNKCNIGVINVTKQHILHHMEDYMKLNKK